MTFHVHILGICGYATSGAALLARERGDTVTGSDDFAYPPVTDVITAAGIEVAKVNPAFRPKYTFAAVNTNVIKTPNTRERSDSSVPASALLGVRLIMGLTSAEGARGVAPAFIARYPSIFSRDG